MVTVELNDKQVKLEVPYQTYIDQVAFLNYIYMNAYNTGKDSVKVT